jgi:hypothetical protein
MTVAITKRDFMNAVRGEVKSMAKAMGVRLSKEALDQLVLQQATDAINGVSMKVFRTRLHGYLLEC